MNMNKSGYKGLLAALLFAYVSPAYAVETVDRTSIADMEKLLASAVGEAAQNGGKAVDIVIDKDLSHARKGDLVLVNYVLSLEDGRLVKTNCADVANDKGRARWDGYRDDGRPAPLEVVTGDSLETPGIADAVSGMAAGDKKHLVIPPEKAFGETDPAKKATLPCVKSYPRTIRLSAEDYVKRFNGFPAKGKEVQISPYFSGKVAEVGEHEVTIELAVKDGGRFEEDFGTVSTGVKGEEVTLTLTPRIGAPFEIQSREGRVVATDGDTFTVDFNHPLAGKPLVLDLEVVSVTKASTFRNMTLPWVENHDAGLAAARKENRPAVLVLYADWCGWCKRLFSESLEDPRVKNLRDRFVWMKVNSDKEKELKTRYGQEGFPMVVILNSDGTVAGKIDGFRDGAGLADELKRLLKLS